MFKVRSAIGRAFISRGPLVRRSGVKLPALHQLQTSPYSQGSINQQPQQLTKMPKKVIFTENAPAPLKGIYNQAIVANGTVYCSGSIGMDPKTKELVKGTIGDRTHQVIKNLTAVLEAAGTSVDNVCKVNVFIDDMSNFQAMNEVYTKYWGETKPCRTCVAVKQLPMGTDVEIECIAVLEDGQSRL